MVLGYHLVWMAYGWWLPNDPRGSMSSYIASDPIAELGELHYGRKRIQPANRVLRAFYDEAQDALKFPLLRFSPEELHAVIISFGKVIQRFGYTCYACAVLPDHVHLCIRKHRDLAEDMIANLQFASAEAVRRVGLRASNHPVWGGPGWKVFLDSVEDIERTNGYIEANPTKLRMAPQLFPFVTLYDGWPFTSSGRIGADRSFPAALRSAKPQSVESGRGRRFEGRSEVRNRSQMICEIGSAPSTPTSF